MFWFCPCFNPPKLLDLLLHFWYCRKAFNKVECMFVILNF
jgi:hypothetical protein